MTNRMKRSAETRIQKAYTYDGKDDYDECDDRVYDLCVSSILLLCKGNRDWKEGKE